MKYLDGQEVKLGDKVQLWNGCYGVVLCAIDINEYSIDYPKEEWGCLKSGVLIKTDDTTLFHYIEADGDLELLTKG